MMTITKNNLMAATKNIMQNATRNMAIALFLLISIAAMAGYNPKVRATGAKSLEDDEILWGEDKTLTVSRGTRIVGDARWVSGPNSLETAKYYIRRVNDDDTETDVIEVTEDNIRTPEGDFDEDLDVVWVADEVGTYRTYSKDDRNSYEVRGPDIVVTEKATNLTVDRNHNGLFDIYDEIGEDSPGALMLAGYGVTGHPELDGDIRVKVVCAGITGAVSLQVDNERVQIYKEVNNVKTLMTGTNLTFNLPDDTVPSYIYLRFYKDEIVNLSLVRNDVALDTVRVTRLSNGLGAPDSLMATTTIVPDHAFVNLMNGNLYFGTVARTYNTPLMGPDLSISYNHLDGIPTAIGLGWRTNYDMRLFDNAIDGNADGKIDATERKTEDLLGFIDETGRRFFFKYDGEKFLSDPKTGLIEATVTLLVATEEDAAAYEMLRNDNRKLYFNEHGRLIRITDLRGYSLTIGRDDDTADTDPASVTDEHDRAHLLTAGSPYPVGTPKNRHFLDTANWSFVYEEDDDDPNTPFLQRMTDITISGGFKHNDGTTSVTCKVDYILTMGNGPRPDINKVGHIYYPKVKESGEDKEYTGTIGYTPATLMAPSTAVMVHGAYLQPTNFTIHPHSDSKTQMISGSGLTARVTTAYTVDYTIRRLTKLTRGTNGDDYEVSFEHDTKGMVEKESVAEGTTTRYTYESYNMPGAWLLTENEIIGSGGKTRYFHSTDGKRAGLLSGITDPCNATTSPHHDYATGVLLSIARPDNGSGKVRRWTNLEADQYHQITQTKSPENRTTYRKHDFRGRLENETDIWSLKTSYGYDAQGRLTSTSLPGSRVISQTYDPLGKTTSKSNELGLLTKYTRDTWGRCVKEEYTAGPGGTTTALTSVEFDYKKHGTGLTQITRKVGTAISHRSLVDADGKLYTKSVFRRLKKDDTTLTECIVEHDYTDEGRLYRVYNAYKSGESKGKYIEYTYYKSGLTETVENQVGSKVNNVYHANGQLESSTDADQFKESYKYDACGRMTIKAMPSSGAIKTDYYADGSVRATTPGTANESGQFLASENGESYKYDADGLPTSTTDEFGVVNTTEHFIAEKRTRTSAEGFANRWVEQRTDGRGFVIQINGPLQDTKFEYYADGAQMWAKRGLPGGRFACSGISRDGYGRTVGTYSDVNTAGDKGLNSSTTFDGMGRVASARNIRGLVTTYMYDDASGELKKVYDNVGTIALANWEFVERDADGRVTKFSRDMEAGKTYVWQQTFYQDGSPNESTGPDEVVVKNTYTPGGRPAKMFINGLLMSETKYAKGGKEISVKQAGMSFEQKTVYDPLGKKIRHDISPTLAHNWTYYNTHGMLKQHYSARRAGSTEEDDWIADYEYNKFGQVTREDKYLSNESVIFDYIHDTYGRLEESKFESRYSKKFTYEPSSMILTKIEEKAGEAVVRFSSSDATTGYDLLGRLKKRTFDGTTDRYVEYGYNGANKLGSSKYVNPTENANSTLEKVYDLRGRLWKIVQNGEVVERKYNNLDMIKSIKYTGKEYEYTYKLGTAQLERIADANDPSRAATFTYYDSGIHKGLVEEIQLPLGRMRKYTYDSARRVSSISNLQQASAAPAGLDMIIASVQSPLTGTDTYIHYRKDDGKVDAVDTYGDDGTRVSHKEFSYTGPGRVQSEIHEGIDPETGEPRSFIRSYDYDQAGNMKLIDSLGINDADPVNAFTQFVQQVLNFNLPDMPVNATPTAGSWTILNGILTGQGITGQEEPSITISATQDFVPTITALFTPDLSAVTLGSDVEAGNDLEVSVVLKKNTEGRYLATARFYKELNEETQLEETKVQTKVTWIPLVPGELPEDPPVDGDPVVLAVGLGALYELGTPVTFTVSALGNSIQAQIGQGVDVAIAEIAEVVVTTGFDLHCAMTEGGLGAKVDVDTLFWREVSSDAPRTKVTRTIDKYGQLTEFNMTSNSTPPPVAGPMSLSSAIQAAANDVLPAPAPKYNTLGLLKEITLGGRLYTYTYDRLNRVQTVSIQGESQAHDFTYFGDTWMRASATNAKSRTTDYLYDGANCIRQSTGLTQTHYPMFGGRPLWRDSSSLIHTFDYTKNHGGINVSGLYGTDGQLQNPIDYTSSGFRVIKGGQQDAYGNYIPPAPFDEHYSSFGYDGRLTDNVTQYHVMPQGLFNPLISRAITPTTSQLAPYSMTQYMPVDPEKVLVFPSTRTVNRLLSQGGLRRQFQKETGWSNDTFYSFVSNTNRTGSSALAADAAKRYHQASPYDIDVGNWVDALGGPMAVMHMALDVVGSIPAIGEAFDVANSILYLGEAIFTGDYSKLKDAGLSALAAIPALGHFAASAKAARYACTTRKIMRAVGVAGHVGMGLYQGQQAYSNYKQGSHGMAALSAGMAALQFMGASKLGFGEMQDMRFCFVAGTLVQTDEGYRNIEDIRPGDKVWSKNDKTGEAGFKPVVQTFVAKPTKLIHLTYRRKETSTHSSQRPQKTATSDDDDGSGSSDDDDPDAQTLTGTAEHPFWSVDRQDWVGMGDLKAGETLLLADDTEAEVVSLREEHAPAGKTFTTYNFEVADWHTYFVASAGRSTDAAAVWVHNECGRRNGVDYGSIPDEHVGRYNRYLDDPTKGNLGADDWLKRAETAWANNNSGNAFERSVREALGASGSKANVGGHIPDLEVGTRFGVTDAKDVIDLSLSPQLKGFAKGARKGGLPFNLVVSPRTQTISDPLLRQIRRTGGGVFEFDPTRRTWSTLDIGTRGRWSR